MLRQLTRAQSTPVLEKGSTYDGWLADAIAAPGVCWDSDNEIFVMTVSFWNISNAKWASGFFTSSDLRNWLYVTGSLRVPSGSNYIHGNAGIERFNGEYWFAYNEYITTADNQVKISRSTDLINWTDDGFIGVGPSTQADPSLRVNPFNNRLETWIIDHSDRSVWLVDKTTVGAWTSQGQQLDGAFPYELNFGEPDVCYLPGSTYRFLWHDAAIVSGERHIFLAISENRDTTWITQGSRLGPSAVNVWENINVFDSACPGAFDLGNGLKLWFLYAGGDIPATTDDTNSSIGLAYIDWDDGSQVFVDNTRNVLHNILGMVG